MKYLLRLLLLLFALFFILPLAFISEVILKTIWNFNLSNNLKLFGAPFKERYFWACNFSTEDIIASRKRVYVTAFDFILDIKTIVKL